MEVNIASLKLDNPLILASGLMDEDAGSMERIFNNGAGAIVTKSIGLKPRDGYPNPTIIELEHGILNAVGLPNPGIENFKDEILTLKKSNIPIIGSIFGSDSKEFVTLAKKMQNYGVNALELNMSCPHAKGYGLEIGCDPDLVKEITSQVKKSTKIPIFVKISPNLSNIIDIAKSAKEGNADGIVAINTVKAMKINLELKIPVLSNKIGGYSGNAIKPIGIRCVYEIKENIDIQIIGVGGITTGNDVIEYFMAGASAVQIGSGIYYRGVDVFKKIKNEIISWMKSHNIDNISELIGVAHK
ncbi:MAG: dihydroorotate dehydrogenase [Thermoplasmatales archaeon SG8-52-3]|nr:MAG: dihydroorotate dehydrogenase [Thermoplasmatales archaeon SG8-52-3]